MQTQPPYLSNNPAPAPTPATIPGSGYSYLALGDSYTIGESVAESDRWGVQLAGMLRAQGVQVATPDIIARTGWTTAELSAAIRESGNRQTYDLVSLLIGVNNQYRGQSIDLYRTELRVLLQTAIKFARNQPTHVIVLSIPDWGVTPYAATRDRAKIAAEIDAFNAVAAEEAKNAGVHYFDITPLSRKALNDASLIASDNLHFSGKMYQQWAAFVLPKTVTIFK
jgi:lysophospholipase L1-like esterase